MAKDKEIKAKPKGYRFKGDNTKRPLVQEQGKANVYFEGRKNRSDKNLTKKLAKGEWIKVEGEEGYPVLGGETSLEWLKNATKYNKIKYNIVSKDGDKKAIITDYGTFWKPSAEAKKYLALSKKNVFDMTADQIEELVEEGTFDMNPTILTYTDNLIEWDEDGHTLHIYKNLEDLLTQKNETEVWELDEDLSEKKGEMWGRNKKGVARYWGDSDMKLKAEAKKKGKKEQGGNVDKDIKAKPRGWRFEGDNNKRPKESEKGEPGTYFEDRKNRSDKNLTKKLEEGGEYAKGGKFKEIEDFGNQTYLKRDWGKVSFDDVKDIELVAVANIKDMEEYVSKEELKKLDGNFQLDITLVPKKKFIGKKLLEESNDENSSVSSDSEINLVNYMGGLRYEPNDKAFFKKEEEAIEYINSKEFLDKLDSEGFLSGFFMDKNFNRAGNTNWEILEYMVGKRDTMFKRASGGSMASGGGVDDKYTVWVGGGEVNDHALTKEEAETLANEYKEKGYDDVVIEKFAKGGKTAEPELGYFIQMESDRPNEARYYQIGIKMPGGFTGLVRDYMGGGSYDTLWAFEGDTLDEEDEEGESIERDDMEGIIINKIYHKYGQAYAKKIVKEIKAKEDELFDFTDYDSVIYKGKIAPKDDLVISEAEFPRINVGMTIFGKTQTFGKGGTIKEDGFFDFLNKKIDITW